MLKIHVLAEHHGKKIFDCICGQTFKWGFQRAQHKRSCAVVLSKKRMDSVVITPPDM